MKWKLFLLQGDDGWDTPHFDESSMERTGDRQTEMDDGVQQDGDTR